MTTDSAEPTEKEIKAALRLAIEALKDYRRRNFAIGHNAFTQGVEMTFTEKDHGHYEKYTKAIQCLAGLVGDPSKIKVIKGDKK